MFKLNKYSGEKLFDLLKETCSKESFYWMQRRSPSPPSPDDYEEYVKASERDEIVSYILEICDREDMSLGIETFSLCVSLLDRFLCNFNVKSKYLECLAISCLYIACKVKEEDENISVTSEFLMDCDCKYSIAELIRMEQMILKKFEWSVNDTTAIDFLYIFYALLVNQHESVALEQSGMASVWSSLTSQQPIFGLYAASMSPPPADLDFMHTLEYQLKQCLCVNELTTTYKPHILAYSLLSVQLEKSFEIMDNSPNPAVNKRAIKDSLNKTMDTIMANCKLSYETLDKCREHVKHHLASMKNMKNLFDNYFNEYMIANRLKNYKPSALFIPQLSAICTQLTAIKEEEEELFMNEESSMAPEDYEGSDGEYEKKETNEDNSYFTRKESKNSKKKKVSPFQFHDEFSNAMNYEQTANNFYEMSVENSNINSSGQPTFMMSYADILAGRAEQKRKLSENSDIECDN